MSLFNRRLEKPKILLVEGKEEAKFFDAFLKHLYINDIDVISIKGKTKQNLKFVLSSIKADNNWYQSIGRGIGISLDADSNPSGTEDSIKSILQNLNFNPPDNALEISVEDGIKTIYMVVPCTEEKGMLETLCLKSVEEEPAYNCVVRLFSCLEEVIEENDLPKNILKAYTHAFLATRKIPDKRLGEAAKAGYWLFDHEAFNNVRTFIQKLHGI